MSSRAELPLNRRADALRLLSLRLGLPELEKIARQPGTVEVFRLTIQYHDARHPDQVATVVKMQAVGPAKSSVHYRQTSEKPLAFHDEIETDRFHALSAAFRKLKFGSLDDLEPPTYNADMWLIEQGCGTFYHDITLSPLHTSAIHTELVNIIQKHWREAIRAINGT